MRVLTPVLALVFLCVAVLASFALAADGKNICIGKLSTGANPALIPPAALTGMSNRGRGSYTVGVSICSSMAAPGPCSTKGAGYVAISNSSGCVNSFDKPLQRPTVSTGGFKVKYGSSVNTKDMVELMVLCNPSTTVDTLTSRSKKFATFSPNKLGGTTYMMVAHSHAACSSKNGPTIRPTRPHHSDMPSGGSSDMPSGGSGSMPFPSGGGSSDMPSGGSGSSDMPSGGSMSSDMPSGGSMSGSSGMPPMPTGSGSSDMPSGGSGSSDMPSGGSGSMPMPSGGSGSSDIPSGDSGSGSGYMPTGGSDPVSWSNSRPDSNDTPPPIPSDLPPMSGSGSGF